MGFYHIPKKFFETCNNKAKSLRISFDFLLSFVPNDALLLLWGYKHVHVFAKTKTNVRNPYTLMNDFAWPSMIN